MRRHKALNKVLKSTIVITGATGFLGSYLINKIADLNTNIILLVRRTDETILKKFPSPKNVKILIYELTQNFEKIKNYIKKADTLIHLSGFVPRSGKIGDDDLGKNIDVNIEGSCKLIQSLPRLKKIIFASTLEVYGIPAILPVTEECPTRPFSYYGASKLAIEKFFSIFSGRNSIKLVILRFTSIYGPGELYDRAIPNFIKKILRNQPPVIYGDGTDERDYLYVEDAADAVISALLRDISGVYNIASGKSYTIRKIAQMLIDISGKKLRPKYKLNKSDKYPKRIVFDITRAANTLGLSPKFDIREGLFKEYKWYEKYY